jgi:hypothetical protein
MKPTDTAELIGELNAQAAKEEFNSTEFIGKLNTGVFANQINHALSEVTSSVDAS